MALIAYLMEFKQNYGPHLIIVPNAVLVNWKVGNQLLLIVCLSGSPLYSLILYFQSEFLNWLPSASCIFYVGGKDQRSKLFSQVRCFHADEI